MVVVDAGEERKRAAEGYLSGGGELLELRPKLVSFTLGLSPTLPQLSVKQKINTMNPG